MNTIHISQIQLPSDRQRKQPSPAVQDIANSIQESGLFHALVLRPDGKTLIAGETRYLALSSLPENFEINYDGKTLPPGHVPFTVSSSDDEITLHTIELHENICRAELHWADRAAAIAKLDELRRLQYGDYHPSANPTGWSAGKTAGEIHKDKDGGNRGSYVTKVKEDIELAAAVVSNPDLAKIKDRSKALRELRLQLRKETRDAALPSLLDTLNAKIQLRVGNCLEVLPTFPDSTFDIILTDPPYGRNLHNHKLWSGQSRDFDDSPEAYQDLMAQLIPLLEAKMKPQSHLYFFCDLFHFEFLSMHLEMNGLTPWRYPIIWDKGTYGSFPNIDYGPRHVYDTIIFANKGNKEVIHHEYDVIRGMVPMLEKEHPDEKPSELLTNLLSRSAQPGDHVLDCFAGSGSIITPAYWKNCKVTLIEQDQQWEPVIRGRIAQLGDF